MTRLVIALLLPAQWTMDPQYIEVEELFTKHGVYIAYKNREPGATAPKTFLVRASPGPVAGFCTARPPLT